MWAQADTRRILGIMGAKVLERELPVAQVQDRFDADGALVDEEVAQALKEILDELVPVPTPA